MKIVITLVQPGIRFSHAKIISVTNHFLKEKSSSKRTKVKGDMWLLEEQERQRRSDKSF
jgi:hypothetical protein